MKTVKHIAYAGLITLFGFSSCTENPHDNDPTSTITPGDKLEVDSARAHVNNSMEEAQKHPDTKDGASASSTPAAAPATNTAQATPSNTATAAGATQQNHK